eukprot:COSAG01_NODE_20469_length_945_cov_454.694836_4_plen_73_part_00
MALCAQGTIVVYKDKVAVVAQSPDNDAEVEVRLRYVGDRSPDSDYVRAVLLVKASDEEQRTAVHFLFRKVNA